MKSPRFVLRTEEVTFTAIRAQGAGGQNVNKVSNAVHLRFDVRASSLPPDLKARLLALHDHRITTEGVVVIKAQTSRSLEANRADAMARLHGLVQSVSTPLKPRKPTQPTFGSRQQRLKSKASRGALKAQRSALKGDD